MATIQEINSEIMFGNFTNDQLNAIIAAVKYRRSQLIKQGVRLLQLGEQVKFVNSRTGGVVTGKVQKVNRKFVIVDTGITRWRVPGNLLETV